ncbi:MAG: hypothetical protein EOP26_05025 [Rhodococcus sp. (in: high G+C Gram-positive bacteria)]|nr:MAG: hypothetical protein EOP26_05025 [Rhodococcus sp. (in: high G+C Gram-positive bacteria)]
MATSARSTNSERRFSRWPRHRAARPSPASCWGFVIESNRSLPCHCVSVYGRQYAVHRCTTHSPPRTSTRWDIRLVHSALPVRPPHVRALDDRLTQQLLGGVAAPVVWQALRRAQAALKDRIETLYHEPADPAGLDRRRA